MMATNEQLPQGVSKAATYYGEFHAGGLSKTTIRPRDFLHISPDNKLTFWRDKERLRVCHAHSTRGLLDAFLQAEALVDDLEKELPDELAEHARTTGSADTNPVARDDRQLPEVLREGIPLPEDPEQRDLLLLLISATAQMNLHELSEEDPELPGRRLMFLDSPRPA